MRVEPDRRQGEQGGVHAAQVGHDVVMPWVARGRLADRWVSRPLPVGDAPDCLPLCEGKMVKRTIPAG